MEGWKDGRRMEGWEGGRRRGGAATKGSSRARPRSAEINGTGFVRPLRFGALFSLSPPIQV